MTNRTFLLLTSIITLLPTTVLKAAIEVSLNNDLLTFTFLPEQSAPLDPGAAYYSSSDIGSIHFIAWTGGDTGGIAPNLA
ncbi:MAG: hypothetical protein ACPGSB_10980, partial [Opitutales bacterium]